ncbi:hypothetical protein [Streptacidiphilus melanogenes]|uniref:hypothetical protein n=1 Tax=Streptacidiphilus melanogenes TaxID=411235 RepID=UPI0005A6295D|nr:hypothetical protein [Streptacidiphilus melanogenes]
MTNTLALRSALRAETVRGAAAVQVVPLLRASLDPASLRADSLEDSPAGRIIAQVLYRDVDAETFDGTAHLAAGVVLVLSWLVPALAARTGAGNPKGLAGELAAQSRCGRGGQYVADVLDRLFDGSAGAPVLRKLLADDQETLLEVVARLAEVAALQARAVAFSDGTDLEAVLAQIEDGLRDHP